MSPQVCTSTEAVGHHLDCAMRDQPQSGIRFAGFDERKQRTFVRRFACGHDSEPQTELLALYRQSCPKCSQVVAKCKKGRGGGDTSNPPPNYLTIPFLKVYILA